jgi:hypothetical protein
MSDVLVLVSLVLLFALAMAYVLGCEQLKGTQS